MTNVLIAIYAGTETHEGLGRVTNALMIGKELKEAGNSVKLMFDGAGTEWVPKLKKEDHMLHPVYQQLKETAEACDFCAGAFEVKDDVDGEVELAGEYEGHPSFKQYIEQGYQILTF